MRTTPELFSAVVVLAFSSAAFAEQVDNPEYTQWAKYKAGTYVTIQQSTEMPGMAQMAGMMAQTKVTTKITEVKPDAVTLEVTSTQTANGQSHDNKTTRTIPAKIDKDAATRPANSLGVQSNLKEGKETMEVKGNKIETATREYTQTTTASAVGGAMGMRGGARGGGDTPIVTHIKDWSSDVIPGGMVKTETTTTVNQGEIKTSMTLIDYQIAK